MGIRIEVRTTGLLSEYLPAGSKKNSAQIEVDDGATPADVMKQLGMPVEENYLVSLNGNLVPRSRRSTQTLSENDALAIMSPIKAG
jgi:thiamine biosynthesis protein ThiS